MVLQHRPLRRGGDDATLITQVHRIATLIRLPRLLLYSLLDMPCLKHGLPCVHVAQVVAFETRTARPRPRRLGFPNVTDSDGRLGQRFPSESAERAPTQSCKSLAGGPASERSLRG